MVGKGVVSILQGRLSGARWAAGQMTSSVQQSRALSGQCRGRSAWHGAALWCVDLAVSAVVWNLPQLYLESGVYSTLLGLLINVLEPLMASGQFV